MKFIWQILNLQHILVTPFVGVWIEILETVQRILSMAVTPFVGVWIEINCDREDERDFPSLPSWECGLKCAATSAAVTAESSLPSWECGLKYGIFCNRIYVFLVTPFVGVWIEIYPIWHLSNQLSSLPSWECGLKSF